MISDGAITLIAWFEFNKNIHESGSDELGTLATYSQQGDWAIRECGPNRRRAVLPFLASAHAAESLRIRTFTNRGGRALAHLSSCSDNVWIVRLGRALSCCVARRVGCHGRTNETLPSDDSDLLRGSRPLLLVGHFST